MKANFTKSRIGSEVLRLLAIGFIVGFFLFFSISSPIAEEDVKETVIKIKYKAAIKGNFIYKILFSWFGGEYKIINLEERLLFSKNSEPAQKVIIVKSKKKKLLNLSSDYNEASTFYSKGKEHKLSEENIFLIFSLLDFVKDSENKPGIKRTFLLRDQNSKDETAIDFEIESQSQEFNKIGGQYFKNSEYQAKFNIAVAREGVEKGNVVEAEFKFTDWPAFILKRVYFYKDGIEIKKDEDVKDEGNAVHEIAR